MTDEILKEFMYCLQKRGYRYEFEDNGSGTIYNKQNQSVFIEQDGSVFYNQSSKRLALEIESVRDEVNEYMTAFQNVPQTTGSGLDDDNTRILLSYNNHELSAIRFPDNAMEFDVCLYAGGLTVSHSHESYNSAKHEFAYRTGLVDRNLLFTVNQLSAIRSAMSHIISTDNDALLQKLDISTVKSVIKQIDTVMPEEKEPMQESEDEDFEQEYE